MTTAWVFPGQGSQQIGMGRDLAARYPEVRELYAAADKTVGFALSTICFEGPAETLQQTANQQPAILTTSIAHLTVLRQLGLAGTGEPAFVAGHSLGEYTALVAAGAVSFTEAVRLVHERGRLMQEAGDTTESAAGSGMASILGLDENIIAAICAESGAEMANYNCPGQIAISGKREAVERAMILAKERGAKRAIPLPVSAAFHSSLMQPMAARLSKYIEEIAWQEGNIPLIANVDAQPLRGTAEIKAELVKQTYSPVQWIKVIETMEREGVDEFIEIGPGKVLSGLIKRIVREARQLNSEDLLKEELARN